MRNVLVADTVFDRVTHQQFLGLISAFDQCNYFSLEDEYSGFGITDMASATTSIRLGSRYKSIYHYFGDPSAPEGLKHLYSDINRILNTKQWVGREFNLFFP
jgi:hypothetical protein